MKKTVLVVSVLVCVFCFLGNASAKGIVNSNGDYDNNGVVNMDDLAEVLAVQDDLNDLNLKQWINNIWMPQLQSCEVDLCPENIYEGDYQILTPEDLDALSGYTKVTGDLLIGTPDDNGYHGVVSFGTNLDPLICLSSIGGSLTINDAHELENLDGLSRLSSIGGFLNISDNRELENLDGLKNLQSMNENPPLSYDLFKYSMLRINNNDKLKNIEGLKNLTSVGNPEVGFRYEISITNNDILDTINGLRNINSFASLRIGANNSLENINGIEKINISHLDISNNDALTDLNALSDVRSIGSLSISSNDDLTNLNGLQNLETIDIGLCLFMNPSLSNIGALSNLCSVGKSDCSVTLGGEYKSCQYRFKVVGNPRLCTNSVETLRDQVLDCPKGGIGFDANKIEIDRNMNCN